jgi:hypothetical protein
VLASNEYKPDGPWACCFSVRKKSFQRYFPEQGEVNPFLHINLHLSLKEQLSINQPLGIQEYYQKILNKVKDPHEAELSLC